MKVKVGDEYEEVEGEDAEDHAPHQGLRRRRDRGHRHVFQSPSTEVTITYVPNREGDKLERLLELLDELET